MNAAQEAHPSFGPRISPRSSATPDFGTDSRASLASGTVTGVAAPSNVFALAHAKERAERTLAHAYGEGHLDDDTLDERMSALAHAEDVAAVERLTVDLELAPEESLAELSDSSRSQALVPQARADLDHGSDQRQIVTLFSEHQQKGPWTPARNTRMLTVLGSALIDLREARLAPGVTHIELRCALAEVTIIVPPGLHVEVECSSILSSVEHEERFSDSDTSAPTIRVGGFAVLSSVEIKERASGEGWWQARKRRRRERKRLRTKRDQRALRGSQRGRRDT